MPDPIPNLSSYKPQRRWLPNPPGGRPHKKPARKKLSERQRRKAATVQRLAPGLSRAGVIIMGTVLAVVVVLVVIIAALRV
jgi:hypothetical protein